VDILLVGGLLLFIMLLLLSGGVWIAMTLAICGWVGQAFFTSTQPGKNLFSAFWESNASWELAALPLFIWMGEILFRTKLSEEMFEGLRPWLNRVPGRLMHTTILGCGIFGSVLLWVALLDEWWLVWRGAVPTYVCEVQARHARGDFSAEV
jgi:TRAP-type mannitol/chloroaromatic compound transport system permease large subunit